MTPLDPSPEEAHDLLRRELLDPRYVDRGLLERLLRWVGRRIDGAVGSAGDVSGLRWFALTALVVALLAGLAWLLSRARRSPRAARRAGALLDDDQLTAAQLRGRARTALAEGRHDDAVLDGVRALVLARVEEGALDDVPGVTAHEAGEQLAVLRPDRAEAARAAAALFDEVCYGDHHATAAQAGDVLALDDAWTAARR